MGINNTWVDWQTVCCTRQGALKGEQIISQQTQSRTFGGQPFVMLVVIVATLYLARGFLLPVTVSLMLALTLSPPVSRLMKIGIPKVLSSLIMLLLSCSLLLGAVWLMLPAIGGWLTTAPEKIESLMHLDQEMVGTLQQVKDSVEKTSEKVSEAVEDVISSEQQAPVMVEQRTWPDTLLTNIQQGAGSTLLILVLTLFLLTNGGDLVMNMVKLAKERQQRRRIIRLFSRLRTETGYYLGAVMLINLTLGAISSVLLWLIDFPMPWIWIVLIAVLRLIPYVGMSIVSALLLLISVTQGDQQLWQILMAPVGFLVLSTLFGFIVDPVVHGIRLRINPIVVFVAVIFWGWLWGPIGAILGVPLLTVIFVVADTLGWKQISQIMTTRLGTVSASENSDGRQ
ncbi:AI-2E family transporter [Lacimicrobium alkaliphilum]|nr:AI-2E family transporter [Lacimicrobium alkaliphilum]